MKLPEDNKEVSKHVECTIHKENIVIYICIYICALVGGNKQHYKDARYML